MAGDYGPPPGPRQLGVHLGEHCDQTVVVAFHPAIAWRFLQVHDIH